MDELTKMSVEELIERHAECLQSQWMFGTNCSKSVAAITHELERRIAENKPSIPKGHIMLDDGRVVKVSKVWWRDDADEGDSAHEDLGYLSENHAIGEVFRVQAAFTLPDEFYVTAVDANGCSDPRPATCEEIAIFRADEKADRQRRVAEWKKQDADRKAAEAARDAEKGNNNDKA